VRRFKLGNRTSADDGTGDGDAVDDDAADSANEGSPRPPSPRRVSRSQLLIAGSLGLIAILVAAAVALPLAVTHPADQSSPSPSDIASTSWAPATIVPQPSTTPSPTATPQPLILNGWPITWDDTYSVLPAVGPNGTTYLSIGVSSTEGSVSVDSLAVDSSGRALTGWQKPPNGKHVMAIEFASDGTMYVTDHNADLWVTTVSAYDPDGSPRPGWPTTSLSWFVFGPSNTLYGGLSGKGEVSGKLVILGSDGKTRAEIGDAADCALIGRAFTRPDGRLFMLCWTDVGQTEGTIVVYDSTGLVSSASADTWSGMTVGAGGTVVAWRRETTTTGDRTVAKATKLAVIGTNGKPAAGWPITLPGAVSEPVVGADGIIYASLAKAGSRSPQVLAIRPSGQTLAGWPYVFPAGSQPREDATGAPGDPSYPVAPVVGRDGGVYVVADDSSHNESVLAVDRNAQLLSGWPAALPGRISTLGVGVCTDWCGSYYEKPLLAISSSGSALLYVHVSDQIVALDESGRVAPGWPKKLGSYTGFDVYSGWTWWTVMPDGGLAAIEVLDSNEGASVSRLWRWAPDGIVAH
jgi:hypothetical protein